MPCSAHEKEQGLSQRLLRSLVGSIPHSTLILWGKQDKILEPAKYVDRFVKDLGEKCTLKVLLHIMCEDHMLSLHSVQISVCMNGCTNACVCLSAASLTLVAVFSHSEC